MYNGLYKAKKLYETRNRNTLKNFIGKTVYIIETGKGKAMIKAIATIESVTMIDSLKEYNKVRRYTKVKKGSAYDFNQDTMRKYLYKLSNVQKIENPFPVPENSIKHGYTWIEIKK